MKDEQATVTRPPTTGNRTLDETLDRLTPDAKVALLALLERWGQDRLVDRVMDRLMPMVEELADPDVLRTICVARNDPQMETDAEWWLAFRDAWQAANP